MRKINGIVIHCSATRAGKVMTAADIDRMHRERGFRCIGYHKFFRLDGTVERGRPDEQIGAHVEGHNADTLGYCYAGGLDNTTGKPADTRTQAQIVAMRREIVLDRKKYSSIKWIKGHRDLSPDTDHDGKVEKREWLKECPCFDVTEWLIEEGL